LGGHFFSCIKIEDEASEPDPASHKRRRAEDEANLTINCCLFIEGEWQELVSVKIDIPTTCSQVETVIFVKKCYFLKKYNSLKGSHLRL